MSFGVRVVSDGFGSGFRRLRHIFKDASEGHRQGSRGVSYKVSGPVVSYKSLKEVSGILGMFQIGLEVFFVDLRMFSRRF